MYRSTVDVVRDTQAGLAGPLVIARPGSLDANGKPSDVDKEIFMMLQVSLLLLLLLWFGRLYLAVIVVPVFYVGMLLCKCSSWHLKSCGIPDGFFLACRTTPCSKHITIELQALQR
jgi:hypothetical protein